MAFFLFVLVTGALFIRPAEFDRGLAGTKHYELLIVACLLSALPAVLAELRRLGSRPITAGVLAMLPAIVLADLARFDVAAAVEHGVDFAKVLVYFFLLLAVVITPGRLRAFLYLVALFALVPTVLATLQFHNSIRLPGFEPLVELGYDGRGEEYPVPRLRGGDSSVFDDPNDMSLLLAAGIVIAYAGITDAALPMVVRAGWIGPMLAFCYAFGLTKSRGGFIALLASAGILFYTRYGRRKTIILGAMFVPALLALLGGRMTSLSASEGTGQERVRIWFEGLILFRHNPIFGIGQGQYKEHVGFVAHNSFVHCFVELGLIGGTIFLATWACALSALLRRGRGESDEWLEPETLRLRPIVTAIVAGYAAGLLSLSRSYLVPTYMILGLAAAYDRIAEDETGEPALTIGPRLASRMILLSIGFLIAIHIFVYRTAHW